MQVVAVTDPMELGFARQAMIGIRIRGALLEVADADRRARRGRLRRGHLRPLRPARRGGLRERRAPARAALGQDPGHRRRGEHRDVHVPHAWSSRPTRGVCAERATPGSRSGTPTRVWTGPRARPLPGDLEADVAIVGAGFTGLWTAHYLAEADPTLRIVVLEAEVAGYGASGRNGGWCSALFPASQDKLAAPAGLEPAPRRWPSTARCAPPSTRSVGSPTAWASPVRQGRHRSVLARTGPSGGGPGRRSTHARSWGRDDLRAPRRGRDRRRRLRATRVRGATYTPDCAAIHPALLVRRLADDVERRGVRVLEHSPVTPDRAGSRGHRRAAPCAPRWWCGRPRATRPASPASAARWCRSTRSCWPPSRCRRATWDGDRAGAAARRSPTTGT